MRKTLALHIALAAALVLAAACATPSIAAEAGGGDAAGTQPAEPKATAPSRPGSVGLSPSTRAITVTWRQGGTADGVEIAYATVRQRSRGRWQTRRVRLGAKTAERSATLSRLAARTRYFVRVRAYVGNGAGGRLCSAWSRTAKAKTSGSRWQALQDEYRWDAATRQLLFVQHTRGSHAKLRLYAKRKASTSYPRWKRVMACSGFVGKKGIAKKCEGDMRTPTGTFRFTGAFGIERDPGALLPYTHLNRYLYWCGDRRWYNRLVDVRKQRHACNGEHLIDYRTFYDYALTIDFNTDPVRYKAGSGIFVHCAKPGHGYTAGCVSMGRKHLLKVMRTVGRGSRICIYER